MTLEEQNSAAYVKALEGKSFYVTTKQGALTMSGSKDSGKNLCNMIIYGVFNTAEKASDFLTKNKMFRYAKVVSV